MSLLFLNQMQSPCSSLLGSTCAVAPVFTKVIYAQCIMEFRFYRQIVGFVKGIRRRKEKTIKIKMKLGAGESREELLALVYQGKSEYFQQNRKFSKDKI